MAAGTPRLSVWTRAHIGFGAENGDGWAVAPAWDPGRRSGSHPLR